MTRLLVWNVSNFGINKLYCPSLKRRKNNGGLTLQQAAQMRKRVFSRVLRAAQPDIIIILEVSSGDTSPNSLASQTGGMDGCVLVLNGLRNTPALSAGQWRLVPPLRIGTQGKAESVGVFYRGQLPNNTGERIFTGPNIWTGGYNGNSVRAGQANPAAYPANGNPDLNAMLVMPNAQPRVIPNGAQYNAGVNEDRVAARTSFNIFDPNNQYGQPTGIDYGPLRPPYMVTFAETNNQGAVQRNLTIFAVHAPAVVGNQQVFITYLANTDEIASPNGNNETRVICGDFNLNLLDANGADAQPYQQLTNLNYSVLLNPAAQPPANLDAYKGYFATHIKAPGDLTAASKFLWSENNGNLAYYPSYGYIGSNFVNNFYSIDNILVRPLAGGGHNYQTTIMNAIVGSPFNQVNPPPVGAPTGTIAMANSFTNPPGGVWPGVPTAQLYQIGRARSLISWGNYGYIYSTSDHFALFADI